MCTAVIHFEDLEKVAKKFRELLEKSGLVFRDNSNLRWKFVSYQTSDKNVTPIVRDSDEVAKEAADWISQNNPERLVLITDLSPTHSGSALSQYGLDVLAKLADYMATNQNINLWVENVEALVKEKRILVVFLTIRGPLKDIFNQNNEWKNIIIGEVGYAGKKPRPNVSEAIAKINATPAAVVYADCSVDRKWASDLIVQWISA
jgi:hypothetical protein